MGVNYYGPLVLPAPEPLPGKAAGDPLLDIILEAFAAVINAETKAAWASVYKTNHAGEAERLTVRNAFAQDPRKFGSRFNADKLPALFAWRQGAPRHVDAGQSLEHRESTISVLWVMPAFTRADGMVRDAFANSIDACVHHFTRYGRHRAWVRAGDVYGDAVNRGSVFAYHTRHVDFDHVSSEPTFVELAYLDPAKEKTPPYEAWMMTFRIIEKNERDFGNDYVPLAYVRAEMTVGPDGALQTADRVVEDGQFQVFLTSISPATGPAAGGTAIMLRGSQFAGTMAVTVGGALATGLSVVDETTIVAASPAGTVGARDVVATRLDVGDSATLAAAFTYT